MCIMDSFHILIICTTLFGFLSSADLTTQNQQDNLGIISTYLNVDDDTTTKAGRDYDSSFGTLHTLQNFSIWASHETTIAIHLVERLQQLERETKLIKEYLKSYQDTSGKAMKYLNEIKHMPQERGDVVGSSAVLGHQMISRYTSVITRLKAILMSAAYTDNQENIRNVLDLNLQEGKSESNNDINNGTGPDLPKSSLWPGWKDKYMSATSFLHMQEVYGFLPNYLQSGSYFDPKSGGVLNAYQCTEIGILALYRGYYYMAVQWLELAKSSTIRDKSISSDVVAFLLKLAIQENNRVLRFLKEENLSGISSQLDAENHFKFENIYIGEIQEGMPEKERITGRSFKYILGRKSNDNSYFYISRYMDLCKGAKFQHPKLQAKLKCYYQRRRHPYLYINPVKVEVLSRSPPVYQLYDVVGQNEIERIKMMGRPYMTLSEVVGTPGIEAMTRARTSVSCGLPQNLIPSIIKFAEIFSGLKVTDNSELTQLAEYTYGRFYAAHTDVHQEDDADVPVEKIRYDLADRLATILYYLEVPKYGGITPFCYPGVSGFPIKGSVVFWYNMYRNGTTRQDVFHGACPVIHGHKIILNHWVKYSGNFRNYKCALKRYK